MPGLLLVMGDVLRVGRDGGGGAVSVLIFFTLLLVFLFTIGEDGLVNRTLVRRIGACRCGGAVIPMAGFGTTIPFLPFAGGGGILPLLDCVELAAV